MALYLLARFLEPCVLSVPLGRTDESSDECSGDTEFSCRSNEVFFVFFTTNESNDECNRVTLSLVAKATWSSFYTN